MKSCHRTATANSKNWIATAIQRNTTAIQLPLPIQRNAIASALNMMAPDSAQQLPKAKCLKGSSICHGFWREMMRFPNERLYFGPLSLTKMFLIPGLLGGYFHMPGLTFTIFTLVCTDRHYMSNPVSYPRWILVALPRSQEVFPS